MNFYNIQKNQFYILLESNECFLTLISSLDYQNVFFSVCLCPNTLTSKEKLIEDMTHFEHEDFSSQNVLLSRIPKQERVR